MALLALPLSLLLQQAASRDQRTFCACVRASLCVCVCVHVHLCVCVLIPRNNLPFNAPRKATTTTKRDENRNRD